MKWNLGWVLLAVAGIFFSAGCSLSGSKWSGVCVIADMGMARMENGVVFPAVKVVCEEGLEESSTPAPQERPASNLPRQISSVGN